MRSYVIAYKFTGIVMDQFSIWLCGVKLLILLLLGLQQTHGWVHETRQPHKNVIISGIS